MEEQNNNVFEGKTVETEVVPQSQKSKLTMQAQGLNDDIPIIDVFWQRKYFILVFAGIGLLIGMVMAMMSPKLYQARASFFALEGSRWSRSSSPLPTSNNMGSFISDTTSAKKDIARQLLLIIYSRSLAKKVIDEMPELAEHFLPGVAKGTPLYKDRLASIVRRSVFVDLTNHTKPPVLVVNMTKPGLAVKTANKYLEVLKKFIHENSLEQETKDRVYLEMQAKSYEKELRNAEEKLRAFELENKLVSLTNQAETALAVLQDLKASLINKQRELRVAANSRVAPKSTIKNLKDEIENLKRDIDFQEKGTVIADRSAATKREYTQIINGGVSAIPDLVIKHKRLERNRDNFAKVHAMLVEKLELAKLKEQMKPTSFFVLDPAVTAGQIAPRVKLQSIYGGIVGFFLASAYLLLTALMLPVNNKS